MIPMHSLWAKSNNRTRGQFECDVIWFCFCFEFVRSHSRCGCCSLVCWRGCVCVLCVCVSVCMCVCVRGVGVFIPLCGNWAYILLISLQRLGIFQLNFDNLIKCSVETFLHPNVQNLKHLQMHNLWLFFYTYYC